MHLCYSLGVLLGTILNVKNVVPNLEWSNTFTGYGTIHRPDKLPNFWIKQFTSLHTPMVKAYSRIMQDPSLTPEWLVEGTTNLLPKKEETWIPKNYRPIACLPTTFKILTSVITDCITIWKRNQS